MQTPLLIGVGSGTFEAYLSSLGKSARKNYVYTAKHNDDLAHALIEFRPALVERFMNLWENQPIEGELVRWGFGLDFVRLLDRKGHLLCFAAYPAAHPDDVLALQFVEKHREYVYCHPPMYDKEQHADRYLAKYMWFRLIEHALRDPEIAWLDLGGGARGTWRDLVASRQRASNASYKWQYVSKQVKENPSQQQPYVVRTGLLSYSKRLVPGTARENRLVASIRRKYVIWRWMHKGRRMQRLLDVFGRSHGK